MFTIEVVDRASSKLKRLTEEMRSRVRTRLVRRAQEFVTRVHDKLNGKVLKKRSGKLYNSIRAKLHETSGGEIWVEAGSYGVPYAAIHEHGGKTKPHTIRPKNARALHFQGRSGGSVFAMVVHHPGSKIPKRSYIHSTLRDMRGTLLKDAAETKRGLWH